MNQFVKILFTFILLFIFSHIHLNAISEKFKPIVAQNSLSNNSVTALATDSYGFIWIGTEYGLARFDGYNYNSFFYRGQTTNEIPNNQIKQLIETSDRNIWVACNKGLAKINPVTMEITQPILGNVEFSKRVIHTIYEDNFNNLWIGTDIGVYVYSLKNKKIKKIDINLSDNESMNVTFIDSDHEKNVWIVSNTGYAKIPRIYCMELFGNKQYDINKFPKNQHVSSFGIDSKGLLWSNDGNKLYCYDLVKDPMLLKPRLMASNIDGKVIYFSKEDQLFIGTRWQGCFMIDYKDSNQDISLNRYWMSNNFRANSNTVNAFCKDKWGNIWAGTKEGLFILQCRHQTPFYNINESYDNKNTPSHQAISCYSQTLDGEIWVGANNGINLFEWIDRKNNQFKISRYSEPSLEQNGDVIQCMVALDKNKLFIGTKNGVINFDTKEKEYYKPVDLNNYLRNNNKKVCKTICKGDDNVLWLGFADDGTVLSYNLITNEIIEVSTFRGKDIWSIVRNDDRVWVGTRTGLYSFLYNNGKFSQLKSYSKEKNKECSLPDEWITSLYVDQNKQLWVGTANGLALYNDSIFREISLNLSDNDIAYICGITEDLNNNIWVSTIKGVFKIDENFQVTFFELSSGKFSTVNYAFGSLLARDGTIFLGGINGITYFRPDEIVRDSIIYPVYFSDVLANGKSLLKENGFNCHNTLCLNYDQNHLLIKFSTLFYANPSHVRYYYRLLGYHSDWFYSDQKNYASFPNLPPGKYIFEVRSTNLLGFVQDNINWFEVEILPPLWRTWWAYLIYIIVILALIVYIYYSLIEKNRLLQEDRNNLWRFQLYTNISHGFKAPLMLMDGPLQKLIKEGKELTEKDRNILLEILQRNTKRLTHLINQLMEFRRIDRGRSVLHLTETNIVTLLKDVYTSFLPILESKKINFKFESEEDFVSLVFDYEKIETVLFNLFSNALKFTEQGGTIVLRLEKDEVKKSIYISLEDTGIGIVKEHLEKIFERFWQEKNNQDSHVRGSGIGLSLAKDFVELHHGKITVKSEIGKGSIFRFSLLLGKEHFRGEPIEVFNNKENNSYTSHFVEIEQGLTLEEGYASVSKLSLPLVFIIDDDADLLHFLQTELMKEFSVRIFTDVQNVFSEIVRDNPVLIVSDVMMNGQEEGFKLCKLIKKNIITSHIPVVLLTGLTSEKEKLSGYEVGADAYIEKPVEIGFLMMRIKQLLGNQEKYKEKIKMDIIINPKDVSVTSVDEKFLTSAMAVVEEYMNDSEFSIDDFAREMSISKTLLNNKLQALSGQSTNEFVKTMRLKRAAKLLLTNAYTISEISYMVGFSSPKYFSTSFKKFFNITPKDYIRSNGSK